MINWSHDFIGDGIVWPVKEGCTQYDLTVGITLIVYLIVFKFQISRLSGQKFIFFHIVSCTSLKDSLFH